MFSSFLDYLVGNDRQDQEEVYENGTNTNANNGQAQQIKFDHPKHFFTISNVFELSKLQILSSTLTYTIDPHPTIQYTYIIHYDPKDKVHSVEVRYNGHTLNKGVFQLVPKRLKHLYENANVTQSSSSSNSTNLEANIEEEKEEVQPPQQASEEPHEPNCDHETELVEHYTIEITIRRPLRRGSRNLSSRNQSIEPIHILGTTSSDHTGADNDAGNVKEQNLLWQLLSNNTETETSNTNGTRARSSSLLSQTSNNRTSLSSLVNLLSQIVESETNTSSNQNQQATYHIFQRSRDNVVSNSEENEENGVSNTMAQDHHVPRLYGNLDESQNSSDEKKLD